MGWCSLDRDSGGGMAWAGVAWSGTLAMEWSGLVKPRVGLYSSEPQIQQLAMRVGFGPQKCVNTISFVEVKNVTKTLKSVRDCG
eukprot:g32975.t1